MLLRSHLGFDQKFLFKKLELLSDLVDLGIDSDFRNLVEKGFVTSNRLIQDFRCFLLQELLAFLYPCNEKKYTQ